MRLGNVVVTGAAGRIGTVVRAGLREEVSRLVLVDRDELTATAPIEEIHRLDLADLAAVVAACKGADSIVHLSGIPDEASFPDLLDSNVLMTYHVLEAARRQNVRRVVLASSNRVTGFYAVAETVTPDMPPRPDGFYGVSKAAVEALGRMYADKFGLSVVCLRIGSFENEPSEQRHLATWLSPRDGLGFVRAALAAEDVHFETMYAVSANTRRYWETDQAQVGYVPADDAENYAAEVTGAAVSQQSPQSGAFADKEYTLRHVSH